MSTQTQDLLKKVRRLEIRSRRLVEDLFSGGTESVFKGRGVEFEEVRPYLPGDEVRDIDWNVTARLGQPYVKRFVEERELSSASRRCGRTIAWAWRWCPTTWSTSCRRAVAACTCCASCVTCSITSPRVAPSSGLPRGSSRARSSAARSCSGSATSRTASMPPIGASWLAAMNSPRSRSATLPTSSCRVRAGCCSRTWRRASAGWSTRTAMRCAATT
ncbi:MAG: DUF58 domain-containing protein [Candidatus Eisenbacteria bacterium]|nr:DUF58 domain-containing protein [Candidatus Eisenbacteria bacterium]